MNELLNSHSSDTFVVLPPYTRVGDVIFGRNANRPRNDIQDIVYVKGGVRPPKLKCTYIEIDESPEAVNSVILSKSAWTWGAEMGSNDKNVAIGYQSVLTNHNINDGDSSVKRLLGVDFVRLGLERGNTAEHAMQVITTLLEKYGQGGPNTPDDKDTNKHCSFIIADPTVGWVIETAGNIWVAEKITSGRRCITNKLSISNHFDLHCDQLYEWCLRNGYWSKGEQFDFSGCFCSGDATGHEYFCEWVIKEDTESRDFDALKMMTVLRERGSNICRGYDSHMPTMGSQVSSLSQNVSVHFFTGTADTTQSIFKPFIFTPNVEMSEFIVSPVNQVYICRNNLEDGIVNHNGGGRNMHIINVHPNAHPLGDTIEVFEKCDECFQRLRHDNNIICESKPRPYHMLHRVHQKKVIRTNDKRKHKWLARWERGIVADIEVCLDSVIEGSEDISVFDGLMKYSVLTELNTYFADEPFAYNLSEMYFSESPIDFY